MKKPAVQQAPVSLSGLFVTEDDSASDCEGSGSAGEGEGDAAQSVFENEVEVQRMTLCGQQLLIRQKAWHRANANQVWPGTFTLAEHLVPSTTTSTTSTSSSSRRYQSGRLLELGSATGALAIALSKTGEFDVITCDIDDEGEVEENIKWNYEHNGLTAPRHIPHTWGTEWDVGALGIKFIIASDILLYVSAYQGLVDSLLTIFRTEPSLIEFLMSWNRRISESSIFFDLMKQAGFSCHCYGHGLYSFYLTDKMDDFLEKLNNETPIVYNKSTKKH